MGFLTFNIIDINECVSGSGCSDDADCINTVGSHTCKCRSGFAGDGFICTGIHKHIHMINLI